MFTLDSSRKSVVRDSIKFSQNGFQPVDNNGRGIFIVHQIGVGYWMSVPTPKKGGVTLYPMKEISEPPDNNT